MDVCGTCNAEVVIFFHKAICLLRHHLSEEYSDLHRKYFEDAISFKYWSDYYSHYCNNYQVKFEKLLDGIMMCDSLTEDYILCTNIVLKKLCSVGCEEIFPAKLIKLFLNEEKSIKEVTDELNGFINNTYFNKF